MLGEYQLLRKIAEGGMGEVYEAMQLKLDRRVAVKILTARLALQPDFLQRFEREAKSAAALNHPNVVQVYDFGEAEGRYYFVMELIEGEDLANHVKQHGKMPVAEALAVVEQTAHALKAAAAKAIIHRDIKPANLLLTRDGRIKVSDLGLAKRLTDDDMTVTGMTLGSPHFLAPEQADDARRVDHRADIYSLGVTLLFLLTGKRPFEGASTFSLVLAHAHKPLPTGVELGTALPDAVETFIQRMTAKNPADRYQDYDALLVDLQSVRSGFAPVAVIGRAWRDAQTVARRKQCLTVGAAVGMVLFAIALLAFNWPRTARKAPREAAQGNDTTPSAAPESPTGGPRPPNQPGPEERPSDEPPPRPAGDEHRGPPGKDKMGRGPLGQSGQSRGMRLPFGPPAPPNFAALKDGPIEQMLAEAEAYALANKSEFKLAIDRYHQLEDKALGTKWEEEVRQKMDSLIRDHEAATKTVIATFTAKMRPFLAKNQPQEAYNAWRQFPQNLRTREVDDRIRQILTRELPQGFEPIP